MLVYAMQYNIYRKTFKWEGCIDTSELQTLDKIKHFGQPLDHTNTF